METQHKDLLDIFQAALNAVAGQAVVKKEIEKGNYPSEFHIVAIGKAADSMVQGVPSERIKSGLLISKHGHINHIQDSRIKCLESDHPVPKEASIKAGQLLLDYLQDLPKNEPCVFLISGGTSALVEVLEDGWDLSQLQKLTNILLANAYPINEINAVRRRLSKIKGGGLWSYLGSRPVYCLMISDVPDDDPAVIGSGLLFPTKENRKDTPPLFIHFNSPSGSSSLRSNVVSRCSADGFPDFPPHKNHTQAKDFKWKIVASLDDAKKAAAKEAEALGYRVKVMSDFLEGNAEQVAKNCVKRLCEEPDTLLIWGGETTVNLPENTGQGGRNQHLALSAAIEMDGEENICLLAAGTDGSDGMTTATGAIVDGMTLMRGEQKKLDAGSYLKRADSNTFFKDTDELIITGATGTNVMDLVIGICS